MNIYVILPAKVVYEDGESEILSLDFVLNEGNLRLHVSKEKVKDLVNLLISLGFTSSFSFHKGEKFSLVNKYFDIWELHFRIFEDGFIDSHLEISREYVEHLTLKSIPSIFEAFEMYMPLYPYLELYNAAKRKWIREVENHYAIPLKRPEKLTPWKLPVAMLLGLLRFISVTRDKLNE